MNHPESEKVRAVANVFHTAHARGRRAVNMMAGEVANLNTFRALTTEEAKEAKCGTVACHAGHYLLEKVVSGEVNIELMETSYEDGALYMAKDIGFLNDGHLREWATLFPLVWGNEVGGGMFVYASAFGPPFADKHNRDVDDLSLLDIANHWEDVADRISRLEKNLPLPPLTENAGDNCKLEKIEEDRQAHIPITYELKE